MQIEASQNTLPPHSPARARWKPLWEGQVAGYKQPPEAAHFHCSYALVQPCHNLYHQHCCTLHAQV